MQPFQKHSSWWLSCAPQHPCHGPAHFAAFNILVVLMLCRLSTTYKWTAVVLPQTRFSLYHAVKAIFCSDDMKLFKNMQIDGYAVLPQTRPSSFHDVEEPFRLDVMQTFWKHSSWWLGRAPQHPLSRPSSFCGVENSFRLYVMQIFNNVQMNGWSCSPKHGPAQITTLSQFFLRMAWSISKTFEVLAGSCSPKHGPILFTV